jgi:pyrimidine-specific ribonucleoside hydrolase
MPGWPIALIAAAAALTAATIAMLLWTGPGPRAGTGHPAAVRREHLPHRRDEPVRRRVAATAAMAASAGLLLAGLAACGSPSPAVGAAAPVIVDTDMSSDDIMALTYLLERTDISVRAITVEGTGVADGPAGARNVLRLISALGIRRHIPVAFGQPRPLAGTAAFPGAWRATADRMYGLDLPPWPGPAPAGTAVRLLTKTLIGSARPVTVITLGPLTDVALALRNRHALTRKIARIYAMAGAIAVPGNEPVHGRAEWNAYIDPAAARIVLTFGVPMTVIPLDASDSVPITMFFADAVQAHRDTTALRLLAALLNDSSYTQAPVYFWDPLTAVAATDSRVLRQHPGRLIVSQAPGPSYGETTLGTSGAAVTLGGSADAALFARDFLATLNHGRAVTVPSVPGSRRLSVSFDGAHFTYHAPASARPGEMAVRLANRSASRAGGYQLIVGKLGRGKTLSDVTAVIRRGHVTAAPRWFQIMSKLPAPPGADAMWGIALAPGRYALVCVLDASNTLRALTEIRVG